MSGDDTGLQLEDLNSRIMTCTLCALSKSRLKAVPGEGPTNANVMFIGEGPGRQEDQHGQPFVGRAGKFLDECLRSISLEREQVFITNIVKCRPTEKSGNWVKDRKPAPEEIEACGPYLNRQIELISPEIICPLGDTAKSQIFRRFGLEDDTIGHVHGRLFLAGRLKVIPLYHPAAALYDKSLSQISLIDFRNLRRILSETGPTGF